MSKGLGKQYQMNVRGDDMPMPLFEIRTRGGYHSEVGRVLTGRLEARSPQAHKPFTRGGSEKKEVRRPKELEDELRSRVEVGSEGVCMGTRTSIS
jgi:hypothetical protein